ncbi:MAG: hypothetical protein ACXACX_22780 [Candidatus Hodarchaeales archaeon]|jgi:hypothetical protein
MSDKDKDKEPDAGMLGLEEIEKEKRDEGDDFNLDVPLVETEEVIEPDERFKEPKKKEAPKAMTPEFKKSIKKENRKKRYFAFRDRARNFFKVENLLESLFRFSDFSLNAFIIIVMIICIIKAVNFIEQGDWIMVLSTGAFILLLSWINRQIT